MQPKKLELSFILNKLKIIALYVDFKKHNGNITIYLIPQLDLKKIPQKPIISSWVPVN